MVGPEEAEAAHNLEAVTDCGAVDTADNDSERVGMLALDTGTPSDYKRFHWRKLHLTGMTHEVSYFDKKYPAVSSLTHCYRLRECLGGMEGNSVVT